MLGTTKIIGFAIAGAQKSGTTALAQYLGQHGGIYLPREKELHIFRHQFRDDAHLSAHINEKYKEAPSGALRGEATPLYLYWPGALELMARHNPDMKIIISLRHPVARAYSAWSMERRRGRETESLSYSVRAGRDRVSRAEGGVHKIYSYVERGFYAAQIKRLLAIFPRNQIFFLRSDHINAGHDSMQSLLNFLGLPAAKFTPIKGNVFPSSLHEKPENLKEDFAYLQKLYTEDLKQLSGLTGLHVADWIAAPPPLTRPNW